MKKLFTGFLISMVLLLVFPVLGQAKRYQDLTYTVYGGKVTITECKSNASGSLVVPQTIEGYPVSAIGDLAFFYCEKLTSITLPNTVTSIGTAAFRGCTKLTEINIPDRVTAIASETFCNCIALTDITIPASVTSIGNDAFFNSGMHNDPSYWQDGIFYIGTWALDVDGKLEGTCTIKDGTTGMSDYLMMHCKDVTHISLPDSLTGIGYRAFYYCRGLEDIVIPGKVDTMKEHTFDACTSLSDVRFEDGVTTIGNNVFYECDSIHRVILPNTLESIGTEAFSGCSGLSEIVIPQNVESIGEGAFQDCDGLESIIVMDGVKKLDKNVFQNCPNLTTVILPETIQDIAYRTFYNCNNLETIYYAGTSQEWKKVTVSRSNTTFVNADKSYDYAGTTTIPSGGTYTVAPVGITSGDSVLIAFYQGNALVYAEQTDFDGNTVSCTPDASYDSVKVFVWDSLSRLVPICDAEQVQ